ncbi:hypothetical protein LXL04_003760 [Taraxacum kok-saghyz]
MHELRTWVLDEEVKTTNKIVHNIRETWKTTESRVSQVGIRAFVGTMPIEYINLDSKLEDPTEGIQEDFISVPRIQYESLVADLVNFTQKLQQAYVIANCPWYTKVKDAFIYGKLKNYLITKYRKITNMSSQQTEANTLLAQTNNETPIHKHMVGQGSTTTRGRGRYRSRGPSRIRETPKLNSQNQEESIADIVARTIRETVPQMLQQHGEEVLKTAEDNVARILRETIDNNINPEHPEHPDPRQEKECSYKEFTNTKPTIYYGTGGLVATMDWISNIEVCFETCQCQPYLSSYMPPLYYKEQYYTGRMELGLPMESLKQQSFHVMSLRSETLKLEIEFLRLEMGNESIQEYTEIFVEKVRFAPFLAAKESRKRKSKLSKKKT